jgi:Tfp pilus assembly protein PilP
MAQSQVALPKDLRWWVNVVLVVIFAAMVFVVGVATAQHQADDQFIGQNELKRAVEDLESYTSEARFIAQHYHQHSAPRPYVEAYSDQLKEAVDSLAQKLDEHPHADVLDDKVSQTIDLAGQLSNQLNEISTQPESQLQPADKMDQFFEQISDNLQDLEEDL